MATGNVLNRTTLRYAEDVELDNYPVEDWVHDPDMSGVDMDWPRYWVLTGDVVSEMNTSEKIAHDATDLPDIIASKVQQLDDDVGAYVRLHYPTRRMMMLLMLSLEATDSAYTNRKAYLAPLMTWIKSVMMYFYTQRTTIAGLQTVQAVEGATWDLPGTFDAIDPEITIEAAAAIED